VRVTIPATDPIAITLPREARVRGIVVDPTGAPVSGALLDADDDVLMAFSFGNEGRRATDENGAFEPRGFEELRQDLGPGRKLGAERAARARARARQGALRRRADSFAKAVRITGELRDRSGAGVAHSQVRIASWTVQLLRAVPDQIRRAASTRPACRPG
jgi:hypothetical protein